MEDGNKYKSSVKHYCLESCKCWLERAFGGGGGGHELDGDRNRST